MSPPSSAAAPLRSTSPVPRAAVGREDALELLPIPAMLCDGGRGRVTVVATNEAFRLAALDEPEGADAFTGRLKARIPAFIVSGRSREAFAFQVGADVDGRHYRGEIALVPSEQGRCLVTLLDRTIELRTERSLRREMTTDALTGLVNRSGFGDRLEAMPAAERARHAVMVVDLERFGRINACLGGLTGDELLISVARRLKGALRGGDVLARIGGDEFGILLAIEDGPVEAEHVAKRLRGALASPFRLCDYEIRVSCAIGVAFGAAEADDPEDLIRHAQFAAKRAKSTGVFEAYQPDAFQAVRTQFGVETSLRRAIEFGLLRLSFQPICELSTGRIKGFESLARWTDEDGREHQPADFIPVAEESGLIVPLGRWALAEAARTLAEWDARAGGNCGVTMAVNLSPIQLQRDAVAPLVEATLAANGLSGDRLSLELTESALVDDPDRIARTLERLRSLGVGVAMDDFGTGYSNLGYLQKLPIDTLKIDKSFVSGMLADGDKVAIVRAVLSLAQALGKSTVAEGVETAELARVLGALGCTWGQGYHYSRPLCADEAYGLIAERAA